MLRPRTFSANAFASSSDGPRQYRPEPGATYRHYTLGSRLAEVIAADGTRDLVTTTVHTRPALIETLTRSTPAAKDEADMADPVRDMTFHFIDDALYRIDVRYDRTRTRGLKHADLIEAISTTFGAIAPGSGARGSRRQPGGALAVVAEWQTPLVSVALLAGLTTSDYQLVVLSERLSAQAAAAISDAERLDALDGPERARALQLREGHGAATAISIARTRNKRAFRF